MLTYRFVVWALYCAIGTHKRPQAFEFLVPSLASSQRVESLWLTHISNGISVTRAFTCVATHPVPGRDTRFCVCQAQLLFNQALPTRSSYVSHHYIMVFIITDIIIVILASLLSYMCQNYDAWLDSCSVRPNGWVICTDTLSTYPSHCHEIRHVRDVLLSARMVIEHNNHAKDRIL